MSLLVSYALLFRFRLNLLFECYELLWNCSMLRELERLFFSYNFRWSSFDNVPRYVAPGAFNIKALTSSNFWLCIVCWPARPKPAVCVMLGFTASV